MMGLSMPKCIKIHLCAIVRPGFPKFSGCIPPDPDRDRGQMQRVGRIILPQFDINSRPYIWIGDLQTKNAPVPSIVTLRHCNSHCKC